MPAVRSPARPTEFTFVRLWDGGTLLDDYVD